MVVFLRREEATAFGFGMCSGCWLRERLIGWGNYSCACGMRPMIAVG